MTISSKDEIYIVDCWGRKIQVFNSKGKFLREWKLVNCDNPPICSDLSISSHDEVYVTSMKNNRFQVYSSQGILLRESDENIRFETPTGIAISPDNEICIVEHDRIRMFDLRM